jgi:hypothetical protein
VPPLVNLSITGFPHLAYFVDRDLLPLPYAPVARRQSKPVVMFGIAPSPSAVASRAEYLHQFLKLLLSMNTPIYILLVFKYKLSFVLDIPYNQHYPNSSILPQDLYLSLLTAIKQQNIVGWNNFLRGFISSYWYSLYTNAHITESLPHSSFPWDLRLVHAVLSLSHNIWQNRNHFLHGSTMEDSWQRLCQRILDQV